MTRNDWSADAVARAEKAMSALEAFWTNFTASTRAGRLLLLPQLPGLRSELAGASEADSYVLERLTKLEDACRQLTRREKLPSSEEDQIVFGLGDVSKIRAQLHGLGLVASESPKPQ